MKKAPSKARKFKLENILEKKYLKNQIKLTKNQQEIKNKIQNYKH